jgi:hypothetical protein
MNDLNRLKKLRAPAGIPPGWIVVGGILLLAVAVYLIIGPQQLANTFGSSAATPIPPGMRVLAAPVSQQQGNVTLTILQAVTDAERTRVIYRVSGLGDDAAAAPGERQTLPLLHLPDGSPVSYRSGAADSMNGGVFEFAPVPAGANDLILDLFRLPLVRAGGAPEKWQLALHLQANPDSVQQTAPASTLNATRAANNELAVLIVRAQQLIQKGYSGFSGKAGWIHMIDENATTGSSSTQLNIETWYEVDAKGLVTRYVTWQRTPDGTLVHSSAAKGQSSYDFVARKAYPYLPTTLTYDWNLLRSLQEDAPQNGYAVKSEDSMCDGQPCLKITLVEPANGAAPARGGTPALPRTEVEYQLSLSSGRILQTQTSDFRADGSKTVTTGRPVTIERAENPPAEVLSALQPPAFP